MRNPNGYGNVIKLKGKRRRPYAVRVTVGFKIANGRKTQDRRYIGFYEKFEDAHAALVDYNLNQAYFLDDLAESTFESLHKRLLQLKSGRSESTKQGYDASFLAMEKLHKRKFKDIRASHLQRILDQDTRSYSSKSTTKSYLRQLYKMAANDDIISTDYAEHLDIGEKKGKSKHSMIPDMIMIKLWDHGTEVSELMLTLAMTGMRISELLEMEPDRINLEQRFMVGGLKTEAGRDRLIPIHPSILPFIEKKKNDPSYWSLHPDTFGKKISGELSEKLSYQMYSHDSRVTLNTNLRRVGVDKLTRQKIIGHSSGDVTDQIYTHVDLSEVINAIDKLDSLPIFSTNICNLLVTYRQDFTPSDSVFSKYATVVEK